MINGHIAAFFSDPGVSLSSGPPHHRRRMAIVCSLTCAAPIKALDALVVLQHSVDASAKESVEETA